MDITNIYLNYLIILLLIFIIYVVTRHYSKKSKNLEIEISKIKSDKISQSTKYGQISEEFFPLEKSYPYNSKNFKFIGNPIDGIQFNDNEVILIEFKTNKSQMSSKQRHIKSLVENNKVSFKLLEAKI